jgi:alkaline phosphatase
LEAISAAWFLNELKLALFTQMELQMISYRSLSRQLFIVLAVIYLLSGMIFPLQADADYSFYTPPSDTSLYPLIPRSSVKNVILMIGDGMGVSQVAAARIRAAGADGKLNIEKMPVLGLIKTHSADGLVTDSAAAATALATGFKTNNGMIGVNPDGKTLVTILEAAGQIGKATGLVATCSYTGATPAAFAAHEMSRYEEAAIGAQMLSNNVDVILAGGRSFLLPQSELGSSRKDDRDLLAEAKAAGYLFVRTRSGLEVVDGTPLLGLFQMGRLTTTEPSEPSLAELTGKAIRLLNRDKDGFFLMVEGSHIDPYCHGNDTDNAIRQTLLFDQAVKAAIDFAAKDKRTLVLVTADHDTGGLAITGGDVSGANMEVKWTDGGHNGEPVAIYAFGAKAEEFTGLRDNTDVPKIIARLLGVKGFPRVVE